MTSQAQPHPYQVGNAFPAIELPDAETNHPSSVLQYRGQKLLLHLFASW